MSFLRRLNPLAKQETHTVDATGEPLEGNQSRHSKEAYVREATDVEPAADRIVEPGELTFEEDTSGGLGRHLGLVSTTFLM